VSTNPPETTITEKAGARPQFQQRALEIQTFGTVTHALPLELEEVVRLEMTERLNQLLADTMTLRDLYKKSHWQVAGPTFYQLHLLFDKHFNIKPPPRGREEVPVQLSGLLEAHKVILGEVRKLARRASELRDDGTNDLVVSQVLRANELQVWF